MEWVRTSRARLDDESGISLLEVVIATFVLAVAIVALASVASASLIQLRISRDRQAATDAATSRLEQMRLTDFASIAMLDTDIITAGLSCTGDDEPFVETSDTAPDANLGPYESTGQGPAGNITVRTIVTWYDDPDVDSDGDGDDDESCGDTPTDVKRVRVEAEWLDGTVTRVVAEETFVSPANRGLPLPKFRIGGDAQTLHFESAEISTPTEKCVEHVLRNVGAPDRYELTVERTDGATKATDAPGVLAGPGPQTGQFGYDFPNAGAGGGQGTWYVTAELEYPITSGTVDELDELGSDPLRRIKGDDTFAQVDTGDQATLRVCYIPTVTVDDGETFDFKVTVYSRFDENEFHEAFHTLTTGTITLGTPWYLFDTNDTTDHNRPTGVVYTMGPEQGAQPDVLGTGSLKDYDKSTDPDDNGGIWLQKGNTTARGIWHEQMTSNTNFAANIELVLWLSLEDALDGDALPGDGAWDQELFVDLRVLRVNESTVDQTLFTNHRITYRHTERADGTNDGWMQVRWTLPNGAFSINKNRFLEVRIHCGAASEKDCDLAYDNTSYRSRIEVVTS